MFRTYTPSLPPSVHHVMLKHKNKKQKNTHTKHKQIDRPPLYYNYNSSIQYLVYIKAKTGLDATKKKLSSTLFHTMEV